MSTKSRKVVGVLGQGFVGLPLALNCLRNGYSVIGFDIDERVVRKIAQGAINSSESEKEEIANYLKNGSYTVTNNPRELEKAEIVVICVPTPMDSDYSPNLSYLEAAVKIIDENVKSGTLVISESTSYPGTLRSIVAKQLRNFDIDSKEIFLSVAPERINPGDQTPFSKIPRVIGAMSSHALKLTEQFYESLGCETFCASSPEVAEMSKLIENTFRQINISFINDLQELAYRSGINLRESIVAASTKPYGFMPFYPSAGIGGHCIPVDPHYLNFFAEQFNMKLNLITESTLINENMGKRIVNRIENEIKGEVKNRNILLLGITYKPNIADTRETSAIKIYEELRLRGANVSWHDSIVDEWNATKSSSIAETSWDVCLLISPHDTLDIDLILKHSRFVLDTSGKFSHNPRIIQI